MKPDQVAASPRGRGSWPHERLQQHFVITATHAAMHDKTSPRPELRNHQDRAAAPAAIACGIGGKHHRGVALAGGSGLWRLNDLELRLPFRISGHLLAPRNREVRCRGREYHVTSAVGCKQALCLRPDAGRKQHDCVSVGALQSYIAAFVLLGRDDHKSIALVAPRTCALVLCEEIGEFSIMQAEAVLIGPVRRTLPGSGTHLKIAASRDRSVRPSKR
jgi:hypothetical protein